tara:strand:- start:255 stop:587 length:333 start_codon:yes stop_codon:yes gene_type:complete
MSKPTEVLEFYNEILEVCERHLTDGSYLKMERDPDSWGPDHELRVYCRGLADSIYDRDLNLEDKIEYKEPEILHIKPIPQKTIDELRAGLKRLEERVAKEGYGKAHTSQD